MKASETFATLALSWIAFSVFPPWIWIYVLVLAVSIKTKRGHHIGNV